MCGAEGVDIRHVTREDSVVERGSVESPVSRAAEGGADSKGCRKFPVIEGLKDVGPEFGGERREAWSGGRRWGEGWEVVYIVIAGEGKREIGIRGIGVRVGVRVIALRVFLE